MATLKKEINIEKIECFELWETIPFECNEIPQITVYIPKERKSPWGVVVFPGGAYIGRAPHEGEGYANFLAENGICAFLVDYRVAPHRFPTPLADARRAVQWVRHRAGIYGISRDKIAVMGSSAGGHLAALTSTYTEEIVIPKRDATDSESYIPNAQVLCYPVISLEKPFGHTGSGRNLLGEDRLDEISQVSPIELVNFSTPPAFIWHTFSDYGVNVINSLAYAASLRNHNIKAEIHIFPDGKHGLGLCMTDEELLTHKDWSQELFNEISGEPNRVLDRNRIWSSLLISWLEYNK